MKKTFLPALAAALVACLLSGLLAAAPVQASGGHDRHGGHAKAGARHKPWQPRTGGFFNNPWGGRTKRFRIERQIVAAIRHARKGSTIRIAVYSFDRRNVAKALLAAHKRGVHVQVLHNDHQYTTAMKMLKHGLGVNRRKKSWDYTCKTGCRSVQGVLHDKIYLFEHTGGARDVVMTGSHNLTANAALHQFNDLLVKADRPDYYKMMLRLFWELRRDKTAKPLFEHKSLPAYQMWVMPHPRTTAKNDPVMKILHHVTCRGTRDGTGSRGRTMIRVSMHAWNDDRGTYIARRLRHLYAKGCNIKVLWSLGGSRMKHVIGMKTQRGTLPRHADGYNTDCDELREVDMYSHQKYMTISGRYGPDRSASLVFTGSSNWTHSGISGDEMILQAKGRRLVRQWNTNFNMIWKHWSRPVGRPGGFRPPQPNCLYYYYRPGVQPRRVTTHGLSFSGAHWEAD